jgi:maltoporin
LNFTDTLAFEVGGGYRIDDTDLAAESNVDSWSVYAQMTYKFAPGCKITPEVGYFSNQDDFTTGYSGGHDYYAGLQWRIDF